MYVVCLATFCKEDCSEFYFIKFMSKGKGSWPESWYVWGTDSKAIRYITWLQFCWVIIIYIHNTHIATPTHDLFLLSVSFPALVSLKWFGAYVLLQRKHTEPLVWRYFISCFFLRQCLSFVGRSSGNFKTLMGRAVEICLLVSLEKRNIQIQYSLILPTSCHSFNPQFILSFYVIFGGHCFPSNVI